LNGGLSTQARMVCLPLGVGLAHGHSPNAVGQCSREWVNIATDGERRYQSVGPLRVLCACPGGARQQDRQ
jgi:hypothetical protein